MNHPQKQITPLPFTITKLPDVTGSQCKFVVEISHELADQLVMIATPFLQQLTNVVERRKEMERSSEGHLESLENEYSLSRIVSLRALHLARVSQVRLEEAASRLALANNFPPQSIINLARQLQRERYQRYIRFRDRTILRLAQAGTKHGELSRRFGITKSTVGAIIKEEKKEALCLR